MTDKFTVRFHGLTLEQRQALIAMPEFSAGAHSDVFQERDDAKRDGIAELELENRLLRARNERLEAEIEALRKDKARLDWLDNNVFHREMSEWDLRTRSDQAMWVMFAPKGPQGTSRNVIDAAMPADTLTQGVAK